MDIEFCVWFRVWSAWRWVWSKAHFVYTMTIDGSSMIELQSMARGYHVPQYYVAYSHSEDPSTVYLYKAMILNACYVLEIHSKSINKPFTLNCHSTQCHWPSTLEWGCSVGACMLIHWSIKFLFFYPKLIQKKNCLLYFTKSYIHCLLTYLAFLLNKMQFYRNAAKKKGASKVENVAMKKGFKNTRYTAHVDWWWGIKFPHENHKNVRCAWYFILNNKCITFFKSNYKHILKQLWVLRCVAITINRLKWKIGQDVVKSAASQTGSSCTCTCLAHTGTAALSL